MTGPGEGLTFWYAPDGWRPQVCEHNTGPPYPCQGCSNRQKTERLEQVTAELLAAREEIQRLTEAEQGTDGRLTEAEFSLMLTLLARHAATDLDQWQRLSLNVADSRVYVRLTWQPQPPHEQDEQYPLLDPVTGRRAQEPS